MDAKHTRRVLIRKEKNMYSDKRTHRKKERSYKG